MDKLQEFFARCELFMERVEASLPTTLQNPNWEESIAFSYVKSPSGVCFLKPVKHVASISFGQLKEINTQRDQLLRNTEQFVNGRPANNVLLTGARGTGKSSLVRACLQAFSTQGLRLIEIDKSHLVDLASIVDLVADRPERFIVFCDDLSFDSNEPGYKVLKSVLDGSISAGASNLVVYATSNRRHLLPEYLAENLGYQHLENGEVHPSEGVEEKISLSERFGLWLSFYPFSQDEYLRIANEWVTTLSRGTIVDPFLWKQEALVWALERGSRTGRVALQFARAYVGAQTSQLG
ncbi:ATP-binding protein [Rhodoferax aquaticus]|uniref:ATP-binding protein n=1 Tax=Rhodoferax aquaticus TaxID=2527691 RepID=A0A515ESH9_9BURK|nr:ATP-binding protein [Rhodoferax aquaticus]QDL55615.1 ATP-binding protein [Rhodoferax aquaticus]